MTEAIERLKEMAARYKRAGKLIEQKAILQAIEALKKL